MDPNYTDTDPALVAEGAALTHEAALDRDRAIAQVVSHAHSRMDDHDDALTEVLARLTAIEENAAAAKDAVGRAVDSSESDAPAGTTKHPLRRRDGESHEDHKARINVKGWGSRYFG